MDDLIFGKLLQDYKDAVHNRNAKQSIIDFWNALGQADRRNHADLKEAQGQMEEAGKALLSHIEQSIPAVDPSGIYNEVLDKAPKGTDPPKVDVKTVQQL